MGEGSARENKLVQNALIGQQDISKFYKDTTTKQIFSKVSSLVRIGLPMEAYFMLFLHRYLTDLYGTEVGRMKLSQIMGCLVELRELCEKSQNEQENIRL